ncbi:MAG TPA: sulfate permease [Gemmatimonadales bacterium]|nr:sulfate permease [Gemmatimonadales bacterium]
MLVPKLVTTLRSYDREQFLSDLTAGIIVGVVAIPLAIAFGIASGVSPQRGLYTAIVAGFIISALGGSRVQIGGPTGAFVVIVYGILQQYGADGLMIATLMAGFILIGLGLARLGGAIKFIPYPVITGFTAGIAVIIFTGEIKDFLGLQMGPVPADFVEKWGAFARHIHTINPSAVLVSGVALAIIVVWPRINRRIPGPFVALIATTLMATLLHLPVETIGSRFGEISGGLPRPVVPHVSWSTATALVQPAFTIAMLAAIESLLSAVVSDGMIGGRHRSNMELIAQGVANIASPIFGGIPATGAIARTATNVKNGGRTPVAGMVHAVTLLLVTLFFGKWAGLIPLATLAAILVVVAYHMSEWRGFRAELKAPRSDVVVLLVTFTLTLLVDLTVAVEVGIVLAVFLFMRRMSEVTNVSVISREFRELSESEEAAAEAETVRQEDVPAGVEIYEINGPFFFGAAESFKSTVARVARKPRVLIIRLRRVPAMDSTALNALRDVVRRSRREGAQVILSGIHAQPMIVLERSGFLDELGPEALAGNFAEALTRARELVQA